MTEKPWDFGTWRCEACGEEMPGERAEPPLDHVHIPGAELSAAERAVESAENAIETAEHVDRSCY